MKKNVLTLAISILVLFVINGCDNRSINVPTNPNQVQANEAEWVLAFSYETHLPGGDFYNIELYDTSDEQKDSGNSVVELTIGDSLVVLQYHNWIPFFNGWRSEDAHLIAQNPLIELKVDNEVVLYTRIEPVKKASAAFPAEFDYQQALTLNWAVSSGNQYQFARAESWANNNEDGYSPTYTYTKQIGVTARSHRFPANCVLPTGTIENTIFVLIVQEINFKIVGKTAVMVYQEEGQGYSQLGQNDLTFHNYSNSIRSSFNLRRNLPILK